MAASLAVSFSLGEALWNLRNEGTQCDVILQGSETNPENIAAHRVVLMARSPYFKAMFGSSMQESQQHKVQLHNIPSAIVYTLVQYAYTSEVKIEEGSVVALLEAALFVDLRPLAEASMDFLQRHLNPNNCLMVFCLADLHHLEDLANYAKGKVLRYFQPIAQSPAFLQLDKDKVMTLIGSEDVNVECEDIVLDAVFSWVGHDPAERLALLAELMSRVRVRHVRNFMRLLDAFNGQLEDRDVDMPEDVFQSTIVAIRQQAIKSEKMRTMCEFSPVFVWFEIDVCCVDPRSGECTELSGMPKGLRVFGTAVVDRCVFLVGAREGTPVLQRYDLDLGKWALMATPHSAHDMGGVVALAGCVYAFGGGDGQPFGSDTQALECYDPATNLWHRLADLPKRLRSFAFMAHQSCLFTFGGLCTERSVFRYNLQTDTWVQCTKMPVPRYNSSACLGDDDTIYGLGGTGDNELVTSFDAYDPRTDEWHAKGDLPTPGLHLAVGTMDGCVYVMGAYDRDTRPYRSEEGIQAYDMVTRKWSIRAAETLDCYTCTAVMLKKEVLRKCQRPVVEDEKDDDGGAEEQNDEAG